MAYFGLTPIFKNKTHKTVENKENQQTITEKNRAFAKENTEVTKRIHKEQKMFDKKEDKQISVGAVSGNVIISQNQSGGITANQVNIGSLPRSISSDSELLFIKEINNFPTKNNNITIRTYLGDAECQNLSIAIKNSFEKAGWTIKGHLYEVPNQPVRNVVLGVPMSDKESKTALIIYNWLNLNNLKTTAELVPDEKGYIIFVGQNL